jgi:hypothetical protein
MVYPGYEDKPPDRRARNQKLYTKPSFVQSAANLQQNRRLVVSTDGIRSDLPLRVLVRPTKQICNVNEAIVRSSSCPRPDITAANRDTAQSGNAALLHWRVERVHIDMDDAA